MRILMIKNIGILVSGDINNPILDCDTIVIEGNKIVEVGGKELWGKYPDAAVIDANGVTVTPGLIDSHCHPCVADYTFRQRSSDYLESEVHGGVTTIVSAGEPHFPGRPTDVAGAKAQAVFLSKSFRNWSPLGAKIHAGAIILEKGMSEKDFEELAEQGLWLVGEVGLGSVKDLAEAATLVEAAKKYGFKVHMHTGGTSLPGSSPVDADAVIQVKPTIASHCNGGPTAISPEEAEKIIDETDAAIEIVQCGNYRMTNIVLKNASEKNQLHRVIFGNDAPSGSGMIPLGILRNISYASSVCGIDPAVTVAMATGNTARVLGLNTGIIAPGKEADLVFMDAPVGSVGGNALAALAAGDLAGISFIIIDGKVAVEKSRNTPPGNVMPKMLY